MEGRWENWRPKKIMFASFFSLSIGLNGIKRVPFSYKTPFSKERGKRKGAAERYENEIALNGPSFALLGLALL
jgi:hypothetical protein